MAEARQKLAALLDDFRAKRGQQEFVFIYEQVLREGTQEDVRRFIDVDQLVALWPRLYLPHWVSRAWAAPGQVRRGAA